MAGMSPHSFSRFFSRSTGSGFVDYVNQVRTNKAFYLLRETDHQINEIVFECGFATVSNFNKQFRKHAGMLPVTTGRSTGTDLPADFLSQNFSN